MERSPVQDAQSNFEMSLRDQLIAAQNGESLHSQDNQRASSGPSMYPPPQPTQHTVDPSIGGPTPQDYTMTGMNMEDAIAAMSADGKEPAKRELSHSKRAAQNRAAQRAFRQRKEAYITKLEQQVNDYRIMEEDFKAVQHDNYRLREYVAVLQSKLAESSAHVPPPPADASHVPHPRGEGLPQHTRQAEQRADLRWQAPITHHPQPVEELARQPESDSPQSSRDHGESTAAPTASMTLYNAPFTSINAGSQQEPRDAHLTQAAVDQLRAAAAEAGELGGQSGPVSAIAKDSKAPPE